MYKLLDLDLVEVLGAQYIGVISSLFLPGRQFIKSLYSLNFYDRFNFTVNIAFIFLGMMLPMILIWFKISASKKKPQNE